MNQNLSEAAINWGRKEVNIGLFSWSNKTLYPDEEINHEENIEGQVDLLGFIGRPGNTSFHCIAGEKYGEFQTKTWANKVLIHLEASMK